MLAVDRLGRAHEAEPRVAERDAVVRVPAAQHRPRHLRRHAADRRAGIDPARGHEAHPRLRVALAHEFDVDAADGIGQIVIGRAGHRVRHAGEAELVEARQELLVMLVAKHPEHPLRRIDSATTRSHGEDQAREVGVVELGSSRRERRIASHGLATLAHDSTDSILTASGGKEVAVAGGLRVQKISADA